MVRRTRRQDEDRLGQVHLAREPLHRLVVDLAAVREDGELVAGQSNIGEDVGNDITQGRHSPIL